MTLYAREAALAMVLGAGVALTRIELSTVLLVAVLASMTFEIFTAYGATDPACRPDYPWLKMLGMKLMVLSLLVPALTLDAVLIFTADLFPGFLDQFPVEWMPVTLSSMAWITMAQSIDGIDHVRRKVGDDQIPPVVLWVIRQLRKMDQARYPGPPDQTPHRRMMDDLTEEDVRKIIKDMKRSDLLDPPPPPLLGGLIVIQNPDEEDSDAPG